MKLTGVTDQLPDGPPRKKAMTNKWPSEIRQINEFAADATMVRYIGNTTTMRAVHLSELSQKSPASATSTVAMMKRSDTDPFLFRALMVWESNSAEKFVGEWEWSKRATMPHFFRVRIHSPLFLISDVREKERKVLFAELKLLCAPYALFVFEPHHVSQCLP